MNFKDTKAAVMIFTLAAYFFVAVPAILSSGNGILIGIDTFLTICLVIFLIKKFIKEHNNDEHE